MLPNNYTPSIGDHFRKLPTVVCDPVTGEVRTTPERNAVITMMSHNHIVVIIDGLEYTLTRGEFARLAKTTMERGAVLTHRNYPIEPAYTEYEDADDASLDWVAGLKKR